MMATTFAAVSVRGNIHDGARNTTEVAVATPTESGVFACPESLGYGQGGANRETARMATSMFLTPCPPDDRRKSEGGFQSQVGAKTMPQGTPTTTGAPAQTPPNEATNQATLPRYQQQGTPHPERIQIAPSPSKSLDAATRQLLIHTALYKAGSLLLAGSFSQSLGQALIASRHMKQLCADSQVGGASHE